MKSLNAKTDISIFMNFRYLRLNLLEKKKKKKKKKSYFHHTFQIISNYEVSEISMKTIFDDGLTSRTLKFTYFGVCIQTLQIFIFLNREGT